MIKDNCSYCEKNVPFSSGNPNYHKTEYNSYVQCENELVTRRIELQTMDNITIEELDKLVLEERTSIEGMTIEQIETRCEELQHAFEVLQRNAKLLKQKQVIALEAREGKLGKMSKEEIKVVKNVKKVDDTLEKMMKALEGRKGSSIANVEEKK